jgi:hypothetical protein
MNPKNKSSPFNISFIPKEAFQPDNPRKLHGWLGNHWVARVVLCVLYQVCMYTLSSSLWVVLRS